MRLQGLIERYILYRQSLGGDCKVLACVLRVFGRSVGPHTKADDVRPEQVNAFLAGPGPVTRSWHTRHNLLRGFYCYAVSRGHVATSPLPTLLPQRPPSFVPYIYTTEELRRLFLVAGAYQGRCSVLAPQTIRTFLLLLYGAGLRIREAVNLNHGDVDGDQAVLTIHMTKFGKTRLVPVGPQMNRALAEYATLSSTPTLEPAPFFTTRGGGRVNQRTMQGAFRRVCARAGIRRSDGGRFQPRLHDLRHTYAVHRLTSWYQHGADVQALLPQLSTYLGHAHLSGTQVYLSMTPELLQRANTCFERYARREERDE